MRYTPTWVIFHDEGSQTPVIGKWIWEAPVMAFKRKSSAIDQLVCEGKIAAAKYARKDPMWDPCPYKKDSVLCVYTQTPHDQEIKELVSEILGFCPVEWKSEEETMKDWAPGGKLRKEYDEYWNENT